MNARNDKRMQLGLSVFGILVVCSLIAVSLGPIILDIFDGGDGEDSTQVDSDTRIEDAFRATAEANPGSAIAAVAYANYLANTGRIMDAIPWYEQALAADPENAAIRLDFGRSLAEAGYPQDAEVQFVRSIEIDPMNPETHFYLGDLYAGWNPPRTDEAIAQYQATIEVGPDTFLAEQAAQRISVLEAAPATPIT